MSSAASLRRDIQALRGVAVLLVLMHHAKVPSLKAGYLGVDIFFVVSGFLITALVARAVQDGTFRFVEFYWRRTWRLLPAAYVTIAACVALSPFLLTDLEMADFVKQVFGAVTFTGNIALWLQTGYFERASELKPLLHVWSLSVEEQYYLLLPAALVFVQRRYWLPAACAVTITSLVLCFVLMSYEPGAVFYLLPTRAWEMGLGSTLAIWEGGRGQPSARFSIQSCASLVVMALIFLFPISRVHPSVDALVICIATVVLIACPLSFLTDGAAARALGWVGDRSYSLYLVHWPIFAFLNSANIGGGGVSWRFRLGGLLLSLVLAATLYWAIEQRYRIVRNSVPVRRCFGVLLASSVILCVTAVAASTWFRSAESYNHRLRANFGLSQECVLVGPFSPKGVCKTAENPRYLVWGDSYAMHLVPGLGASAESSVVQATRSTCAPVSGVALFDPTGRGETDAKSCIAFNSAVVRGLSAEFDTAQVVVLSSAWGYLLGSKVLLEDGRVVTADPDLVAARVQLVVRAIRSAGKRVVLFAPPLWPGFDAGRCNERLTTGRWSFGGTSDCNFELDKARARSAVVRSLVERISREIDADVITFDDILCDKATNTCATKWGDTLLYRDVGHLSYEGSVAIAQRKKLVQLIEKLAR